MYGAGYACSVSFSLTFLQSVFCHVKLSFTFRFLSHKQGFEKYLEYLGRCDSDRVYDDERCVTTGI